MTTNRPPRRSRRLVPSDGMTVGFALLVAVNVAALWAGPLVGYLVLGSTVVLLFALVRWVRNGSRLPIREQRHGDRWHRDVVEPLPAGAGPSSGSYFTDADLDVDQLLSEIHAHIDHRNGRQDDQGRAAA